jgi:hypothetical protein
MKQGMRIENLTRKQQIAFLEWLYRKLNKELFDNRLDGSMVIEIPDDINWGNALADFGAHNTFGVDITTGEEWVELGEVNIRFSQAYLHSMHKMKTQTEQIREIVTTMLHEMIHAYCYEYCIDDENHNAAWQKAAAEHGLRSYYDSNGKRIREWLSPDVESIVASIRIR